MGPHGLDPCAGNWPPVPLLEVLGSVCPDRKPVFRHMVPKNLPHSSTVWGRRACKGLEFLKGMEMFFGLQGTDKDHYLLF